MKVSLTPAWVHKASAFAVMAAASMAAWHWEDVVSQQQAATIVFALGGAKVLIELLTRNTDTTQNENGS